MRKLKKDETVTTYGQVVLRWTGESLVMLNTDGDIYTCETGEEVDYDDNNVPVVGIYDEDEIVEEETSKVENSVGINKIKIDGLITNDITRALCDRDEITPQEASDTYEEALHDLKKEIESGYRSSNFCEIYFGLEPDFMDTLLSDVELLYEHI